MFVKIRQLSILIVLLLTGCFIGLPDPHENFIEILHSQIGHKWNEMPSYQFPSEEHLISSRALPNGNIEKRYKRHKRTWGFGEKGTCIQIYEIDPKTDIIVDAGFEGKKTDCVINP
jgi:hypothetical protein